MYTLLLQVVQSRACCHQSSRFPSPQYLGSRTWTGWCAACACPSRLSHDHRSYTHPSGIEPHQTVPPAKHHHKWYGHLHYILAVWTEALKNTIRSWQNAKFCPKWLKYFKENENRFCYIRQQWPWMKVKIIQNGMKLYSSEIYIILLSSKERFGKTSNASLCYIFLNQNHLHLLSWIYPDNIATL